MNKKTENRILAYIREGKILSDDLGEDIRLNINRDYGNGDLRAGDYEFVSHDDGFKTIDYEPISHGASSVDQWQHGIDPERIVSLTEPPKEKSPDTDQSEQGLSVEKLAQPHTTTNGEEGQA